MNQIPGRTPPLALAAARLCRCGPFAAAAEPAADQRDELAVRIDALAAEHLSRTGGAGLSIAVARQGGPSFRAARQ